MNRVCDLPGAKSRFEGWRFPYRAKDGNPIGIETVDAWKSPQAYDWMDIGTSMNLREQQRRRSIFASICLFVVVLLYAPLAGAAWASHQSACCMSSQCPIPGHHHPKIPAAPANHMDCGHDMSGMMACAMSCCHDSDRSVFTSIAFVLPPSMAAAASAAIQSPIELANPLHFPRSIEPLFPPPRFVSAAV
jgi:hypothetical protein